MEALGIYESGVCECGFHESMASNKDNLFTFDVKVCPVCRGSAKFARIQEHADSEYDKSLGENPPPGLHRAGDGRRTFVRPMSPTEIESIAKKAPGK